MTPIDFCCYVATSSGLSNYHGSKGESQAKQYEQKEQK